jgi:aromatic ring-opening dioxygenase catalytic subunit (LigB family)
VAFPALFLSHGSPMHAVDPGGAGRAWRELADALPRPRAVVIATAHWETAEPSLTAATRLQTIHDFGGFPEELYRLRYDAPGAPDVAGRAAELVRGGHVTHNLRDWFQNRDATAPMPYARDFAEWLATTLEAGDATSVLAWRERAPGAERAHPTDEHLLPLFVALGAAGPRAVAHRVHRGYEGAALAMDAYRFEARAA